MHGSCASWRAWSFAGGGHDDAYTIPLAYHARNAPHIPLFTSEKYRRYHALPAYRSRSGSMMHMSRPRSESEMMPAARSSVSDGDVRMMMMMRRAARRRCAALRRMLRR